MLLYIHVPFCRRKCRYCAFYSNPLTRSGDEMAVYLSALYAELGQWGRRLGRVPVESVFFGGGTPSLLDPDQLEGVLDCVGRTFEVLPGAEISMEANPDSLHTAEKASGFLAAGVNRISLGVQSLHDGMLETLGRLHRANVPGHTGSGLRQFEPRSDVGAPGADAGAVAGGCARGNRAWAGAHFRIWADFGAGDASCGILRGCGAAFGRRAVRNVS